MPPVVLSPSARLLFALLPSSYGDIDDPDPIVARWLESQAVEINRQRALLQAIRATSIPAVADDTVGALSRWEFALRLPINAPGATLDQRRTAVCGALQSRSIIGGAGFTAALRAYASPNHLNITTNAPSPLQVSIVVDEDDADLESIRQFAERIAPANLEILMGFTGGWIVGVSRVGDLI